MTPPLAPPPKKDPQRRTRQPTAPTAARSRAALGLAAAAAEGRFMLQVCGECGAVQYPPRDACARCLSVDLPWRDVAPEGRMIAETTVRISSGVYFRERSPWRVGVVQLDAGPTVICHVHGDVERGGPVQLAIKLDKSGQGVLFALPPDPTPDMADDPELREMTCDPKHRRVLIADGRNENAAALARALKEAGASMIFVGEAESWRPNPNREALAAIEGVEILPLDVTDTRSVQSLAGEIGGKTDILVNNARFVRPGGIFERGDTTFAREELEVNVLGMMRLAQAFGPAMRGRSADGVNSAVAWVNILSVYAHSNWPAYGAFSAASAGALSLSQCLRAEMQAGGIRVMNVHTGPTDDEWHQPLPPPKVAPAALAKAVVAGLRDGLEDVVVGDVAEDVIDRWRAGPKILEKELAASGGDGQ
ncbi:SDR family oxidoreductase [Amorphus orientalis]|uniref:NAD(P)-dependent dehydrogenase (Short-subunit alcohol dehydrogenase family)/uncharacterized OB-fold protein n=1 Tax=Amorphus orientalis TaxID=649198 RepID=A0AAE4AVY7_9HYPH|nr:SDR family oxidoreductase [Amorphus orientalis]MDQ0317204.1 NAD(P)-dependent dehydrogenase (short-subunit alcohol dehydrogenase family)/uncharacterized OB-fold protein [Amorphus orientalis]